VSTALNTSTELESKAPAIQIENLGKSFNFGRIKVLDDVNLRVADGDIFALIGPNGAGKTTLMGCMLALLRPSRGRIRIFGKPPDHIDVRRVTGFLPERPSFENWMNPKEFLTFHQMLAGHSRDPSAKQEIEEALAAVELNYVAKRQIAKFSRGMLQRLGLAQVLIGKPKLCFLDEPTSGMDPPGMELVRNIVQRFRKDGVTVVINSHHLDEIERVCTRFAFIRKGKIETEEAISTLNKKLLIARWPEGEKPDIELLTKTLDECGVTLADQNDGYVEILLTGRQDAPKVIERLVHSGIRLDEIFFDRRGLSELFRPAVQQQRAEASGSIEDETEQ
jgi:ABC-2 type transport system ATP-binding protein